MLINYTKKQVGLNMEFVKYKEVLCLVIMEQKKD